MELTSRVEEGLRLPVLLWRLPVPARAISSAPLGGGVGLRRWVLNAQVDPSYGRVDIEAHLRHLAATAGLDGRGVGMLTAADVEARRIARDGGVTVTATVGLGQPIRAAAAAEADPAGRVGTINVVAVVPTRLSDAALVNAVTTIAEAKAQALRDAGLDATGTASDAVCVLCPADGRPERFGGPRSRWGSRVARAAHGAILAGARS